MLTLYDEFAGWGGSSQGVTAIPGVELILAANHSPIAVEVHSLNFPSADHYLGDVTKADLTRFPRADLFWASPACPPFSNARGQKQYFDASTEALFADPWETEEERAARADLVKRRALMDEIPRYLRAVAGRGEPVLAGVVENVPQARRWEDWDRWVREIEGLGYSTRLIALNAMHAGPGWVGQVPQSRDRLLFAYWWRGLGRTPDWDKWLRPRAHCPGCDTWVYAVQAWKQRGIDMGSYGAQYVYRCPTSGCARVVHPPVLPAAAAIDWALPPGRRIGDRDKPLKPKTMARVEAGLDMVRREGALIPLSARAGVDRAYPPSQPLRTQTTRHETGLVLPPFWVLLRGGGSLGAGGAYRISDPWMTFSARGTHHALVQPTPGVDWSTVLLPYYGTARPRPVAEPVATLTTRDRYAVLGPADGLRAEDCTFRMLSPDEIKAACGFAPDYRVAGSKRQQVAGYGNAVPPAMAASPAAALVECVTGEALERAA